MSDQQMLSEAIGWIILFGGAGILLGRMRGHPIFGFFIGVVMGPLGLIIILLSRNDRFKCHACKMPVERDASICPHCRSALGPQPLAPKLDARKDFYYHIFHEEEVKGPYLLSQIIEWKKQGAVDGLTQVKRHDSEIWTSLSDVIGL